MAKNSFEINVLRIEFLRAVSSGDIGSLSQLFKNPELESIIEKPIKPSNTTDNNPQSTEEEITKGKNSLKEVTKLQPEETQTTPKDPLNKDHQSGGKNINDPKIRLIKRDDFEKLKKFVALNAPKDKDNTNLLPEEDKNSSINTLNGHQYRHNAQERSRLCRKMQEDILRDMLPELLPEQEGLQKFYQACTANDTAPPMMLPSFHLIHLHWLDQEDKKKALTEFKSLIKKLKPNPEIKTFKLSDLNLKKDEKDKKEDESWLVVKNTFLNYYGRNLIRILDIKAFVDKELKASTGPKHGGYKEEREETEKKVACIKFSSFLSELIKNEQYKPDMKLLDIERLIPQQKKLEFSRAKDILFSFYRSDLLSLIHLSDIDKIQENPHNSSDIEKEYPEFKFISELFSQNKQKSISEIRGIYVSKKIEERKASLTPSAIECLEHANKSTYYWIEPEPVIKGTKSSSEVQGRYFRFSFSDFVQIIWSFPIFFRIIGGLLNNLLLSLPIMRGKEEEGPSPSPSPRGP